LSREISARLALRHQNLEKLPINLQNRSTIYRLKNVYLELIEMITPYGEKLKTNSSNHIDEVALKEFNIDILPKSRLLLNQEITNATSRIYDEKLHQLDNNEYNWDIHSLLDDMHFFLIGFRVIVDQQISLYQKIQQISTERN
jgi:hypothetical protein